MGRASISTQDCSNLSPQKNGIISVSWPLYSMASTIQLEQSYYLTCMILWFEKSTMALDMGGAKIPIIPPNARQN